MATSNVTSAEYFANAIASSGLTQKEIAQRSGLASANVISMWKSGDSKIPLTRVQALAAACGVDAGNFLYLVLSETQPELLNVMNEVWGFAYEPAFREKTG